MAVVLMVVSLLVLSAATVAVASVGELRRIDTSNVNDSHEVKEVGAHEEEVDDHTEEADEPGVPTDDHETDAEEAVAGGNDEEASGEEGGHEEEAAGEEGEEGGHHVAWMVPGWQSVFTVLAVVYFGLGVTLLPFIMAKEEH